MADRGARSDGPEPRSVTAGAQIREVAGRQHGIVSVRQLRGAGVPRHVVRRRIARGDFERVYRGVYAMGPVRGRRWREWAALLVAGETAVLSHDTAAELHGMIRSPRTDRPVHVTVRRGHPETRAGVCVHRTGSLHVDELSTVEGLPTTTPIRTLVDLAGQLAAVELERLVARADRAGLLDGADVDQALRRHAGRAGIGALRRLLAPGVAAAFTRSELEDRFLALLRTAELPEPTTNVRVAGLEVDALWREEGLIAEVDGFGVHRGRAAFERDRRRDAVLVAAGYRVARFTWTEVTASPFVVVARLGQALGWAERAARQSRS